MSNYLELIALVWFFDLLAGLFRVFQAQGQ